MCERLHLNTIASRRCVCECTIKLKFHGSSFPRSILVTSSRGCPQQVVRVVLVYFAERHRHTDKRAALHRSRPPTDQSRKRVARWTGKSPDTPDMSGASTRMSRRRYEEMTGPVEFQLYSAPREKVVRRRRRAV